MSIGDWIYDLRDEVDQLKAELAKFYECEGNCSPDDGFGHEGLKIYHKEGE